MGMRILQLISSQGYFGAETMTVALSKSLANLGHRCVVGALVDSRKPNYDVLTAAESQGLSVEAIPCRKRWDGNTVRLVRALVRKHNVDVLHTHGYKADLYGYVANMNSQVTLMATCHNWPDKAISMRAYASIDRYTLRKFDAVATASPAIHATLIRSGISTEKVALIPNGVDTELFQPGTPTLREELKLERRSVIGFAGRLVPGKGVNHLIEAAKDVLAVVPDAAFVIAGDGPSRSQLVELAEHLGVASAFHFVGTRSDMVGFYSSLHVLALPSLDECMPMCLLEAMACTKPVVATRVGAVPDMIQNGHTGFLVKPKDSRAVGAAILRVLQSPARGHVMGLAARARVLDGYSSAQVAPRYANLYERLLSTGKNSLSAAR